MIVTIDGPAGSGKSTVARMLADRLQVRFLDTGAMYRAVALAVLQAGVQESDHHQVDRLVRGVDLEFQGARLLLNGEDVSGQIRSPEVTAVSSIIASNPAVRARMVHLQRSIGATGSLVTEGRDQGTVVFPDAEFKFFLTASLDARAWRRQQELVSRGSHLDWQVVRDQLRQRDERDETRQHAPMKPAANAVVVDTSEKTIAGVVELLLQKVLAGPSMAQAAQDGHDQAASSS